MHKYLKTEGIILKRRNYKDADRMITILTKDAGKITARALGIRKIKSRKKSHLELLNYVNLYLVEGKLWYVITQAEAIKPFNSIKKNLATIQWGYYFAEIVEKLTPEDEVNEKLFYLVRNTLITFDSSENPLVILSGNLKVLILGGFFSKETLSSISKVYTKELWTLAKTGYTDLPPIDIKSKPEDLFIIIKELTEDVLEIPIKTQINFS